MSVPVADDQRIRARARHVHSSARKARLVLEHIRGLPAVDAQAILEFQPRAVARDAGKVLASAIANAEHNGGHDVDDLVVAAAYADEGPTLTRGRARARGRVNRIRKRTCHITIELLVVEPAEDTPRRHSRPAARRTAAAPATAAVEPEPVAEVAEPEVEQPEAAEPEVAAEPAAATEPEAAAAPEPEPEPEPEAVAEPAPKPKPRRKPRPKPADESPAESEEATE